MFMRKNEEDKMRSEGRLPPGQALTQKFPVLHYGPVPNFDPVTWSFRFFGEVEEQKSFTWQEFKDLPRYKVVMDIHCVTRWSKFDTEWEGVSVRDLVDKKILKSRVRAVCHPICRVWLYRQPAAESSAGRKLLLATHFNGEPSVRSRSAGTRSSGSHPGREESDGALFWKGAKWLARPGIHQQRTIRASGRQAGITMKPMYGRKNGLINDLLKKYNYSDLVGLIII